MVSQKHKQENPTEENIPGFCSQHFPGVRGHLAESQGSLKSLTGNSVILSEEKNSGCWTANNKYPSQYLTPQGFSLHCTAYQIFCHNQRLGKYREKKEIVKTVNESLTNTDLQGFKSPATEIAI